MHLEDFHSLSSDQQQNTILFNVLKGESIFRLPAGDAGDFFQVLSQSIESVVFAQNQDDAVFFEVCAVDHGFVLPTNAFWRLI